MGELGKQLESDFDSVKNLFGKGKKKSFKEQYADRVKERKREAEELEYKAKLDTLDRLDFGDDKLGKIKRKLKKLLE